ncbi:MAG: galactonate dehydratase [Porticoccaceae bacterium]|nr:galactonate dehydratase [Porticoccaceae bacterium]
MNLTIASVLRLHPIDNIVIALRDILAGELISNHGVTVHAPSAVPKGHKIASAPISEGQNILRYGQVIGQASSVILPGEHIHTHNLAMVDKEKKYLFATSNAPLSKIEHDRTFLGYVRADGKVGTRNYIGLLTSVNCSGSVVRFIADAAERRGLLNDFHNIDGIVPLVHGTGCGMSRSDEGYSNLFRTLSGYARHPNFGGILIVGLGCEVMQVDDLFGHRATDLDGELRCMTIQGSGGTRKTIEQGVNELRGIAQIANNVRRERVSISKLTIGLQCGGSDGFSGITANPALGYSSDLLVRHGGTTILSETTEIYGAEHLLTRRAETVEVGEKLIERIRWWEDYAARHGGEINNNPSRGNIKGGLTNILEKSLGAVAKSGTAPLRDVYKFGEIVTKNGFVFMDSPGFDPCSVTGQVASGANLIIFTTGRGSVSGYKPTPCIKLATNSEMYARMCDDMDLNCGDIISEGRNIQEKGKEIFELMIKVASGKPSKSEALGFGEVEFVPWQIGAVM